MTTDPRKLAMIEGDLGSGNAHRKDSIGYMLVRWQPYFSWRPVYLGNRLSQAGKADKLGWVWLEWVERRHARAYEGHSVRSFWLYRRRGESVAGVGGNAYSD